jgi:hypothetical protein
MADDLDQELAQRLPHVDRGWADEVILELRLRGAAFGLASAALVILGPLAGSWALMRHSEGALRFILDHALVMCGAGAVVTAAAVALAVGLPEPALRLRPSLAVALGVACCALAAGASVWRGRTGGAEDDPITFPVV